MSEAHVFVIRVGMAAALSAIVLGPTPPAGYSAVSPGVYAAIVAVGVVVLAVPAQLRHHVRRPVGQRPGVSARGVSVRGVGGARAVPVVRERTTSP